MSLSIAPVPTSAPSCSTLGSPSCQGASAARPAAPTPCDGFDCAPAGAASAPSLTAPPSACTQLLQNAVHVEQLIQAGANGLWTVPITRLLQKANQLSDSESSPLQLLRYAEHASEVVDEGGNGLWTFQVTQLLALAKQLAAQFGG